MDRIKNRWRTFLVGLFLAAATLAAFWPVTHHDFVNCDDQSYVYENPALQAGLHWPSVVWAFTTGYAGNWHPLTWLSHLLDVQWFGLNAGGHHLTSLLLHVANSLLLFLVLLRLTGAGEGRKKAEGLMQDSRAFWCSAMVAALFALHPLHVESVAWIAERKDVLSAFFFLLTLWAYANYVQAREGGLFPLTPALSPEERQRAEIRRPKAEIGSPEPGANSGCEDLTQRVAAGSSSLRSFAFLCVSASRMGPACVWYWTAVAMFACGLMSKPMLVTLPFVLLLLDFWPLRRWGLQTQDSRCQTPLPAPQHKTLDSRPKILALGLRPSGFGFRVSFSLTLLVEKAPFFALAAASSVVTFLVQQQAGAVAAANTLPFDQRLENALVAYFLYLSRTVWPSGLSIFYPYRHELPAGLLAASILVLLVISALAWISLRQRPYVAVGWFWFLGMLVPVIGLVQVGQQALADRYTYLPLIGIFIAIVWTAADWKSKVWSLKSKVQGPEAEVQRPKSNVQSPDPSDTFHAPRSTPRSTVPSSTFDVQRSTFDVRRSTFTIPSLLAALVLTACWLVTRAQVQHWQNSETLFRHALAVTTDNALAHDSLGDALAKLGRVDEAEPHFAEAVRIWPRYPEALSDLGLTRVMHGQVEDGIALYRRALAVRPRDWRTHNNLAQALSLQAKLDDAIQEYQTALELNPGATDTRGYLAAALVQLGRTNEASAVFEDALKLKPNDAAAHFKYASLLWALGQTEPAALQFRAALQYEPGGAETHRRYGLLLAGTGHAPEAIEQFREASRLQPSAETHYNLATTLLQQGQPEEAVEEYRESLRLNPDSPLALNDLAWVLAASADAHLRNGPEAVTRAERACQLTQSREPLLVGTLAAAYAEAGRFPDAVKTAQQAITLATAAGLQAVADRNRQLLEFYRAAKPFHEARQ